MDIYSLMHKWTGYRVDGEKKKKLTLEERNEFLSEISYDSASRIEQWFADNPESLSFDELFDGNLRMIIELDSPDAKKLRNVVGLLKSEGWEIPDNEYNKPEFRVKSVKHVDTELQGAGGGERSYFKEIADLVLEKEEERVIPTNPATIKNGMAGTKTTSVKKLSMSKIIARSKVLRETDKKWWQSKQQYYTKDDNWLQIQNFFNKTQQGSQFIVLSRHPMDVLRMSDIDSIRSCHSENGEYFNCAVHEAQGHGPIAYLVDADEVSDYLHQNTGELEDYDIADEPDEPSEPDFGTVEQQIYKMKKYYLDSLRFRRRLNDLFNTNKEPWRIEREVKGQWAINKFDPDLFMHVMKNFFSGKRLSAGTQRFAKPVVDKHAAFDLEDLNDRLNTLDDQEVFRDPSRDVRGFGATARLRLRKFEDQDTETEFAVPERIVYGPHPPGFKKVIMNWAWNGQKELFKTPDGSDWVPDAADVGRHGGRWEDTKDGKLLNSFFSNLEDFNIEEDGWEEYANVSSLGDFDDSSEIARVENQVRDIIEIFDQNHSGKGVSLTANVVELEDSYTDRADYHISKSAEMIFVLKLPSTEQRKELGMPPFPGYPVDTQELYTDGSLEHVRKAIMDSVGNSIGFLEDLSTWRRVGKTALITVNLVDPENDGTFEGFENFVSELEQYIDEDYDPDERPYHQAQMALEKAFQDLGYLTEPDILTFARTLKDLDDELEVLELWGVEFDGDEVEEIEDPIELECNFREAFTVNKKIISMLNKDLLKQMFGAGHVRHRWTAEMNPSERSWYFTIKPLPGGKFSQLVRKHMGPLLRAARMQVAKDLSEEDVAINSEKFRSFFRNVSRGEYGLKIHDEAIDYYIKFEFPKNESKEYLFALLDFAKYLDKNIGMIDKAFQMSIKEIFADYVDYIKANPGDQTEDDEEFEEEV